MSAPPNSPHWPGASPAELQLLAAVSDGDVAEPLKLPGPAPKPTAPKGWEGRTVSAEVVVAILTGRMTTSPHHRGLHLKGALISGDLDLRWATLCCPLRLEGCRIGGKLQLEDARVKDLVIADSVLTEGLNAPRLQAEGTIDLCGTTVEGKVMLYDAVTGGDLDLRRAICNDEVCADGIQIRADLICNGSRFRKGFSASGAKVKRGGYFSGSHLTAPATEDGVVGDALTLECADFKAGLFLNWLQPANDDTNEGQEAVRRFHAEGGVNLYSLHLGASLQASGGLFENRHGQALRLYGAHIEGDVMCEAPLDPSDKLIAGPGGPLRFEAKGTVCLHAARIDKQISLRGAKIESEHVAVDARLLQVGRNILLDAVRDSKQRYVEYYDDLVRFEAKGRVWLLSTTVTGDIRFHGAKLVATGDNRALDGQRMSVGGEFSWKCVHCVGGIDLRHARVGVLDDDIDSWGTGDPSARTLALDGFVCEALSQPEDASAALPLAVGASARSDVSSGAPRDWKVRRDWLARQRTYSSQPYLMLARVYREAGDEHAARKISMARFNELLTSKGDPRQWWRWLLRYTIGHGYEPWRAIGFAVVLWALGWGVIHLAVEHHAMVATNETAAEVGRAVNHEERARPDPTNCRSDDYPCLTPALYAADLILPVVSLGQRDHWRANGSLFYRSFIPFLTIMGWLLGTMVIAGLTGLIRRE